MPNNYKIGPPSLDDMQGKWSIRLETQVVAELPIIGRPPHTVSGKTMHRHLTENLGRVTEGSTATDVYGKIFFRFNNEEWIPERWLVECGSMD